MTTDERDKFARLWAERERPTAEEMRKLIRLRINSDIPKMKASIESALKDLLLSGRSR